MANQPGKLFPTPKRKDFSYSTFSVCYMLHASRHPVLWPLGLGEISRDSNVSARIQAQTKYSRRSQEERQQVSLVVTLLGPPGCKHFSSQAQKGRLNICNVKIFFSFFSFCLTSRVRRAASLKERVKGMKSVVLFME